MSSEKVYELCPKCYGSLYMNRDGYSCGNCLYQWSENGVECVVCTNSNILPYYKDCWYKCGVCREIFYVDKPVGIKKDNNK